MSNELLWSIIAVSLFTGITVSAFITCTIAAIYYAIKERKPKRRNRRNRRNRR